MQDVVPSVTKGLVLQLFCCDNGNKALCLRCLALTSMSRRFLQRGGEENASIGIVLTFLNNEEC